MKALIGYSAGAFLSLIVSMHPAVAQPQQAPGIIEIMGCNYVDGSGPADLARPMGAFNAWADEQGFENFNVSTLSPIFTSDALTYDVLFMNRWTDASAMGRDLAVFYGEDGADAVADFESVVDCSATTLFAGILLQPPGEARNGGPIQFFNCTVKENRAMGDGIGAVSQWAEATPSEYGAGHAVLIPLAGENPEATYSFKWIVLHESYENYGNSLAALFGEASPTLGNIIEPVMDCDSARVYHQVLNRQAQPAD